MVTIADVENWQDLIETELASNPPEQAGIQLRLDPEARTARLETFHKINGTPMAEHHGLILAWGVALNVDGPALVEELRGVDLQWELDQVCDDWSCRWDGSNHVGRLGAAGQDASDWLGRYLANEDRDNPLPTLERGEGLWDAADWLQDCPAELTAQTTDDELAELAENIEAEALVDRVLLHRTLEALESYRQWLIDEADEDGE